MASRKRLTKVEKEILNRLQTEFDDKKTKSFATRAYRRNFSVHRGARKVAPNECVIFGNDGFTSDVRSQVEVAKLVQELDRLGIKIVGFGLGEDEGYTWALRVAFHDDFVLDRLVWHIWFVGSCGMRSSPVAASLNTYPKLLKSPKAA